MKKPNPKTLGPKMAAAKAARSEKSETRPSKSGPAPLAETLDKIVGTITPTKGDEAAMAKLRNRNFKTEDDAYRAINAAHLIPEQFGMRLAKIADGMFGLVATVETAPDDEPISFDVEIKPAAPMAKSQITDPAVTKLPARVAKGGGSKQRDAKAAKTPPDDGEDTDADLAANEREPIVPKPETPDLLAGLLTRDVRIVAEFKSPHADVRQHVHHMLRTLGSGYTLHVFKPDALDDSAPIDTVTWFQYNEARAALRGTPRAPKDADGETQTAPRRGPPPRVPGETKQGRAVALLIRKDGATKDELIKATGWAIRQAYINRIAQTAKMTPKTLGADRWKLE